MNRVLNWAHFDKKQGYAYEAAVPYNTDGKAKTCDDVAPGLVGKTSEVLAMLL